MIIETNLSGLQRKRDFLLVRLDFIPEPTDKTYAVHHIYWPVEPFAYPGKVGPMGQPLNQRDYDLWWTSLPRAWKTNPALSHLFPIQPGLSKDALAAEIKSRFPAKDIALLDSLLVDPTGERLREIGLRMSTKKMSPTRVATSLDLNAALAEFAGMKIADLSALGEGGLPLDTAIDIGGGATNRTASLTITNVTRVDKNNPANDTGTLDTWKLHLAADGTAVEVATFYVVSGNNLSTRDSEAWGAVASGSVQTLTVGVETEVQTGDYAGVFGTGGTIDALASVAGVGIWSAGGDKIPCTNTAFVSDVNWFISIEASGATPSVGFIPRIIIM